MGRRKAALIASGNVLRDYQQATAEGQLMAEERQTRALGELFSARGDETRDCR